MKTIRLSVGIAMVLSCLSGVSYAAPCSISSGTTGHIVVSSNGKSLSSQLTGGQAGSFSFSQCNNLTLSVAAPVATGSNPALTSRLAEIYNSSNGTGTVVADSNGKTVTISGNTSKTYSAHMSINAVNPLLPGSYSYKVTVTIAPQ